MYEENFYIDKNNLIKWRDFSNSEIEAFMQRAKPSELGLGLCKEEINLHITNLLLIIQIPLTFSTHQLIFVFSSFLL